MIVQKQTTPFQIIKPNGLEFQTVTRADIKHITDKSYVCDLYDSEGKKIAQDARFFFADAIHEQLNTGERGLVRKEKPTEEWNIPEIKKYLDSKVSEEDESLYTDKMLKSDLLKIVKPKDGIDGNYK